MSIYDLIDNKIVGHGEAVVCLFEHCNLSCVFCPQDHDSIIGASHKDIMAKAPLVREWMKKKNQQYKIHIMGGELFQDRWIYKGFIDTYQEFIDYLTINDGVYINFVTNLVFEESEIVLNFLKKNNLKISVSYDPSGRFNKHAFEIFKKNLDVFKDHIEMISIVATKQTIDKIIKGDKMFEYLYAKYKCDFDQFLPSNENARSLMPSEKEMYEFYKTLVAKYPECLNIEHFVNQKPANKMICTRGNSFTIMPDNSIPEGCSGSIFLTDAQTKELGGTQIVENFFEKYNCFECEYFQRCPFTCFIKQDYKYIDYNMDECVFKATFRYADSIYKSPTC